MLRNLQIRNYKSLHKVDIDLPPFCVVVGANAAGKTNFADAIEFLALTAKNGLPAAVTEKGGYQNICFRRARRAKSPIEFRIEVTGIGMNFYSKKKATKTEFRFEYHFAFRAQKPTIRSEFSVLLEECRVAARSMGSADPWRDELSYRFDARGERTWEIEGEPDLVPRKVLNDVLETWAKTPSRDDLFLTSRLRGLPPFTFLTEYMASFRVFQVVPEYARRAASASGSPEMGKYGQNMPAALDALQREHPPAFEDLLSCLQLAVPSVEKVETDYVETRELGLFLKEKGMKRRMYASELSDGTLRTISIFLPIVNPAYSLVVIEEPENCIHPWVTREFVDQCRERAEKKQIVVTTHSPVLVSRLRPDELLVAERREGMTEILPSSQLGPEIEKVIREGVMDLGAYWDSGAMRAVPAPSLPYEGTDE